jgi:Domain of unknown function (DUF4180)
MTPNILSCAPDGPPMVGGREAADVVGEALGLGAELVVVPVERLTEDFFSLRSGVAGEILQKFATYRLRLVVLGDIADHVRASTALRDLVRECNRGRSTWFVTDEAELDARLAEDS